MKQQILEKLNQIDTITKQIRALFENDTSITITSVEWIDEKLMKIQWEYYGEGDPLIDIEIRDATENGSWLSMKSYNKNWDVKASKGEHLVGLGRNNSDQNQWEVRIWVLDDPKIVSDTELLAPRDQDEKNEGSPREKSNVRVGWWDYEAGLGGDVGKSKSKSIGYIVEDGLPAIAIIEGFNEDRDDIRERLKDSATFITKYKSGTENLFTILTDEPFSEGKDAQIMEYMVSEAKEIIGDQYEFSFTFKEKAFVDSRELPKNADWIGINFYPFRFEDGVDSKEQFTDRFDRIIEAAKQKSNAKIFIVAQTFYGGKWKKPPVESVDWYIEVCEKHNIELLLWWKYGSSDEWIGAKDMPALLDRINSI